MACHRRGSDCAAIFSNRNHIVVAHPPIGDPPVAAVPGRRYASLMTLDELGILCGTDKSSLRKAYLSHYERLFAPLRDTAFNLIEIGAYNGASLRTWAEYLDRKSTRLNSSHPSISYAVFCLKKKKKNHRRIIV